MKRSCLLFPFSKRTLNLIENNDSINSYEIVSVSSFPGWINGFEPFISERNIKIVDISNIDNALKQVDAVIVPPLLDIDYLPEIKKTVKKIIESGIEILNLSGCVFDNKDIIAESNCALDKGNSIFDINSCVIYISELGKFCDVDQAEVRMRDCFTNLGIKTKVISSSWSAELFGFIKFPGFMYDDSIDEITKVRRFNQFVHCLESDGTELIIVSLMEAVLCYPESFVSSQNAYRHYLAAKAVPPDYSLCCVYAKRYSKEEIVILKEKYIETTGSNLDLVLMSTTMIDWIAYNDIEKRIAFLKTSHSIIEMYSEEINKMTIIKIVPINNVDSAVCDILAKLTSNSNHYVVL